MVLEAAATRGLEQKGYNAVYFSTAFFFLGCHIITKDFL
jgi:hypothetical protein